MMINQAALTRAFYNSVVGTGLKSIGSLTRLSDIPADHQELRARTRSRELTVLALTFVAGLALELGTSLLGPKIRKNPIMEFIPQALAIYLSEVASRRLTNYSEALRGALETKPETPVVSDWFQRQVLKPQVSARMEFVPPVKPELPADVYFSARPKSSENLSSRAHKMRGFS